MKSKAVSGMMLTLLLVGMLTLAVNIQPAKASGTIYIGSDYTFTSNIYEPIVVIADNIIIDGNGYTLQGIGSGVGLNLTARSNVTIKNIRIRDFQNGIRLYSSSNNTINENNITTNYSEYGVYLYSSNYNNIYRNKVTGEGSGIRIDYSDFNLISGNTIGSTTTDLVEGVNIVDSLYTTISDNTVVNCVGGIGTNPWSNHTTISRNNVSLCTFMGGGFGIGLCSDEDTVSGNILSLNDIGIHIVYGNNSIIYHNNFLNNMQQADIYKSGYANLWDDGYPSGGNYWSDYTGVDLYNGPFQNGTGCDGICDTPYVIDENNQDNYPLMKPYPDATPPIITIVSPENKAYTTASIPLVFTIDECTCWMGYSVDGELNVTSVGNTTLTSLLDGSHSVVVYANDTVGNMGASSTVYFTVDTTPPNITEASQTPLSNNVLPEDQIKVNATITDNLSGVKQAILNYTNGNGTWVTKNMTNLEGNVWNGTIPAFEYCTYVNYTIVAEDEVGNIITIEEVLGYQYQYHVIPEFPSLLILPLFMIATLLAVIVYRRKHTM